MESVVSKASSYISNSKSKKVKTAINKSFSKGGSKMSNNPEEAAQKLASMVKQYAESSGLPKPVAEIASVLNCNAPIYNGDGTATVDINFGDDLYRSSLSPSRYDGIENIIALYNNGVDKCSEGTVMNQIWGYWHGDYVGSRTYIPSTHFIQDAVNGFKASFSGIYNVINVKIDEEYEQ